MKLRAIDITSLREVSYESAAKRRAEARGSELARKIYEGKDLIYKIWPRYNKTWRRIYVGSSPILLHNPRSSSGQFALPGFLAGLYDRETAPGFVDYIYSGKRLVGYVTLKGAPIEPDDIDSAECSTLIDRVIERTVKHRHVLRDLYHANIVRLPDGRLSLIDLETPISHLDTLDLNAEIEGGALRRGTASRYRKFLVDFFDRRVSSPAILSARSNPQITSPLVENDSQPAIESGGLTAFAWVRTLKTKLEEI
jgi:hypothetical protein